jgi:LSD1 subclass zinc finger protein
MIATSVDITMSSPPTKYAMLRVGPPVVEVLIKGADNGTDGIIEPVLTTLTTRFEFVYAERGMTAELCDAMRGCATCHKWTSRSVDVFCLRRQLRLTPLGSADSVKCALCQKTFHLLCLDPPLNRKPALGYSWACAGCSKRHEEESDNGTPPPTSREASVPRRLAPKSIVGQKNKGKAPES